MDDAESTSLSMRWTHSCAARDVLSFGVESPERWQDLRRQSLS